MDAISKRPGKRDKPREPIRGHDATRRPPPLTFYALRITPCRPGLPRRLAAPEHQREGGSISAKAGSRFTPIVTAEFDIFFTISIQYFENTHHRPLPLNHLCKMPKKTVKFRDDVAPTSPPPGCHHAP
jgi:hypothetical protein